MHLSERDVCSKFITPAVVDAGWDLHTIVRLPKGVFNPYTSIKTNLLFFTKGEKTKNVWYYEHPYPQGYKSYSKTKPMRIAEFEPEKEWWTDRKETEQSWCISAQQIIDSGFNLDIKNPNTVEEGPGDPDELLAEYETVLSELESSRSELKQALAAALEGNRS